MNIDQFLPRLIKKFQFSEEDGKLIAEAFQTAVDEKAFQLLQEHDIKAKNKLRELLKTIDEEHTKKLKLACETIKQRISSFYEKRLKDQQKSINEEIKKALKTQDSYYTKKLTYFVENMKKFYKKDLNRSKNRTIQRLIKEGKLLPAVFVKKQTNRLVGLLSEYLDKSLQSAPILKQLHNVAKNSIQLQQTNERLKMIEEENQRLKAQLKLEQLLSLVPITEQKMLRDIFENKPLEYITEHFQTEYERLRKINRETLANEVRKNLPERFKDRQVLTESKKSDTLIHTYLKQLNKK